MPAIERATDIRELLSRAIAEPTNATLIEALRNRRKEVVEAFNSPNFELTNEQLEALETNPESFAPIFDAVGEISMFSEQDLKTLDDMLEIKRADDEMVGKEFKAGLLEGKFHEERLDTLAKFLEASVERADSETRDVLLRLPDVQAAMPECKLLVCFGIRPLNVFYATEAVMSAALQLWGDDLRPGDQLSVMRSGKTESPSNGRVIEFSRIIDEIVAMAEIDRPVANVLWQWLSTVCERTHLFLFGGFKKSSGMKEAATPDLVQLEKLTNRLPLREQWSECQENHRRTRKEYFTAR